MRNLFAVASICMFFALAAYAQPASNTGIATATKTETTTKSAPVFRPTKDQIKQGQTVLKDKKLYDGDVTGVYNDATRAAIKSFQKSNGLDENGRFDKATLQKMNIPLTESQGGTATSTKSATSSSTSTAKRPAPFRANEDQIKAAQKILIDGKLYTGSQTGDLDDTTREGLKKYQEANKLKVTGTLNAITLEKMGIVLTDAQKANVAAAAAYEAAKNK